MKRQGRTLVALHGKEPDHALGHLVEATQAIGLDLVAQDITKPQARDSTKRPMARAGVTAWTPPYGYRKTDHKVTVVVQGRQRQVRPVEIVQQQAEWG